MIFAMLITGTVHAQTDPLEMEFVFTWGTPEDEEVYAMEFISDEIVYIAGDKGLGTVAGDHRFFLTKLNVSKLRSGFAHYDWSFNWERNDANGTFGDMMIDSSGNIYITGTLHKNNKDIFLMRFDSAGTLQWNITWGTSAHESTSGIPYLGPAWQPSGKCLVMDSTNNVYVAGKRGHDVVLIKYNDVGIYQWNRTWSITDYSGSPTEGYFQDIEIDSNDNLYLAICGQYSYYGIKNFGVIKCNIDGVLQWNATFYRSGPFWVEAPGHILIDSDGLFYYSVHFLTKFDFNTGDRLWNSTPWSGPPVKMDYDSLGNLNILTGTYEEIPGGCRIFFHTFTSDGIEQVNYTDITYKVPKDFCIDNEGSKYILSYSYYSQETNSVVIEKINSNGERQYIFNWGSPEDGYDDDFPSRMFIDSSNNIYVSGRTSGFGGGGDYNIFFSAFSKTVSTTPTVPFDLTFVILTTVCIAVVLFIRRRRKLT